MAVLWKGRVVLSIEEALASFFRGVVGDGCDKKSDTHTHQKERGQKQAEHEREKCEGRNGDWGDLGKRKRRKVHNYQTNTYT